MPGLRMSDSPYRGGGAARPVVLSPGAALLVPPGRARQGRRPPAGEGAAWRRWERYDGTSGSESRPAHQVELPTRPTGLGPGCASRCRRGRAVGRHPCRKSSRSSQSRRKRPQHLAQGNTPPLGQNAPYGPAWWRCTTSRASPLPGPPVFGLKKLWLLASEARQAGGGPLWASGRRSGGMWATPVPKGQPTAGGVVQAREAGAMSTRRADLSKVINRRSA